MFKKFVAGKRMLQKPTMSGTTKNFSLGRTTEINGEKYIYIQAVAGKRLLAQECQEGDADCTVDKHHYKFILVETPATVNLHPTADAKNKDAKAIKQAYSDEGVEPPVKKIMSANGRIEFESKGSTVTAAAAASAKTTSLSGINLPKVKDMSVMTLTMVKTELAMLEQVIDERVLAVGFHAAQNADCRRRISDFAQARGKAVDLAEINRWLTSNLPTHDDMFCVHLRACYEKPPAAKGARAIYEHIATLQAQMNTYSALPQKIFIAFFYNMVDADGTLGPSVTALIRSMMGSAPNPDMSMLRTAIERLYPLKDEKPTVVEPIDPDRGEVFYADAKGKKGKGGWTAKSDWHGKGDNWYTKNSGKGTGWTPKPFWKGAENDGWYSKHGGKNAMHDGGKGHGPGKRTKVYMTHDTAAAEWNAGWNSNDWYGWNDNDWHHDAGSWHETQAEPAGVAEHEGTSTQPDVIGTAKKLTTTSRVHEGTTESTHYVDEAEIEHIYYTEAPAGAGHTMIIDTGARHSIVGEKTANAYLEEARKEGACVVQAEQKKFSFGDKTKVYESAAQLHARAVFGGVPAIIRFHIVKADVPFLLGRKALASMDARISVKDDVLEFGDMDTAVHMTETESGHCAIRFHEPGVTVPWMEDAVKDTVL